MFNFPKPVVVQAAEASFPKALIYLPHISGGKKEADAHMNQVFVAGTQHLVNTQGPLTDPRAEMYGFFEVKNNQKDVLSVSLINYAYTGGAHGATIEKSYTFQASTGHAYTLKQLFKPGADYVKALSEPIKRAIKERNIETFEPFQAIRPDQDFYLADRSIVIYFQQYEIAPYVYGLLYFPISIYELTDIIPDNSPLNALMNV
ncbi:DUF3298 domain-containing protein [Paenibacillus yanchengensis]|uniref:DUF3298 domain-containing protein n=1 Tax=Paenibacillus yanchengensis TaxID=2035833 RepID=A0ABW4YPZ0_9BACL